VIRAELKSALSELLAESRQVKLEPKKKSSEILVPLTIFSSKKLGVLEALVKYLKEEEGLSFKEIGILIKKDNKSLWSTYQKASKKQSAAFKKHSTFVPLTDFVVDDLSCFESVTLNLKNYYGLDFGKISNLFGRNYHTIWTTYKRAEKKAR
jgi:hypothetical protein